MTPTSPPSRPLRLSGTARGWDIGLSIAVLVIVASLLCLLFVFTLFGVMITAACDGGCRLGMFTAGWLIALIVPFVVLLATLVWSIVRMVRARRSLVVAALGSLASLLAWGGGIGMMVSSVPGFTW